MILDESFPPDPRVRNEAQELIKAGHEVFLFAPDYDSKFPARENFHGIEVRRYKMLPHIQRFGAFAYSFPIYHMAYKKAIIECITETQPDVVHIHDIKIAGIFFGKNPIFTLNRVILDLHENRPEILKFYPVYQKFYGKLFISPKKWKRKEKEFLDRARKVIVVTHEAAKFYTDTLNIDPDKLVVVPNTINERFFTGYHIEESIVEKYKNRWVLLYIGKTGLRRGLGTVINALPQLSVDIPNIKLVILGTSKDDRNLKSLTAELDVEELVDFEGWVKPKYFQSYISASKLGLCPFIRNIHHDTTYSNKMFQYLSLGIPVVASDCKAQARIVREQSCGLVFQSGSVEEFAMSVLQLYRDKSGTARMAENGKRFVREEFTWEKTGRSLIEMYNDF